MTPQNKLVIGHLYRKNLNLYGDDGNVEVMVSRALSRGFSVEVRDLGIDTKINAENTSDINFIFMGGGPDSAQKEVYEDLIKNKKDFIESYVNEGGVGLYVCGSYQLLGKYYKASDGSILEGLSVFDIHTEHFGNNKPRCIGNCVARITNKIINDSLFIHLNKTGRDIVGFENHGGRTFLGNTDDCFTKVLTGNGNNSEDSTEGYIYKNSIGTYFHGPLLAKNPHIADYLIAKSLLLEDLKPLDDFLINTAHTASKKLKQ